MSFKELFREKYAETLHAARKGDEDGVLAGLKGLCALFADQFRKNNDDSIVIKAQLSHWYDVFADYARIVDANGLSDSRVQAFFALADDTDLPSLDNISDATAGGTPMGGIDMAGLVPPIGAAGRTKREKTPEAPAVEPMPGHGSSENASGTPPAAAEAEPAAPAYDPDTLAGFIGQQHIVKVLLKEIAIAKAEGRKHLDNILLFGNPGLGKSTLMRLIAKELGVRYEWMDCTQYRNSQQSLKALQKFLMRVARDNEPVVIAFDEIHCLSEDLQSSLLTLLESRVYVSPLDKNGNGVQIPIEEFTFIAATTDDNKVLGTIKDRCLRLKFQLTDYTPAELKRIYRNKVAAKGLTISEDAIATCIPRSRGSIRYVNSFVEGMDRTLYNDKGVRISTHIDLQTAERFFRERGIDAIGLEKKDLEILHALLETPDGVGADTLAARVNLDPKKYLSEYEPYLIRIGFMNVTGRGRCLTEKALDYLKESE